MSGWMGSFWMLWFIGWRFERLSDDRDGIRGTLAPDGKDTWPHSLAIIKIPKDPN
jgi:hypothetical protein